MRKLFPIFIIMVLAGFYLSDFVFAQQRNRNVTSNQVLQGLLQHRTPSGKTINDLIAERANKRDSRAAYGAPNWKAEVRSDGLFIISCTEGVSFQTSPQQRSTAVEILRWLFDGKNYYSIIPNDLDDGLDDVAMPKLGP